MNYHPTSQVPPSPTGYYEHQMHPHLIPASMMTAMSDQAMQLVWNKTPIDFQRKSIHLLLTMIYTPYSPLSVVSSSGHQWQIMS